MNPAQLLGHFDRLADAADAIPRLRRFILDLAVRGKLVEQDPNDEPAAELLGRQRCITVDQQPLWRIPSSWAWSSFACIGEIIGGGTPSKTNPEFWKGHTPWVSPKDMKLDVIHDAQDHISEQAIEESTAKHIPVGALLMVVRGMILARSFPTAVTAVTVTINQDMKAVVPFRPELSRPLLLIAKGMTPVVLRLVQRSTHGTCKLLTEDLFNVPLPIPPLAEQQRIVAKVDELMALCDRLEAAQEERERRRDRLAAASLHRLNQPDGEAIAFREHTRFHLRHLPRLTARPDQIPALRQTILNLAVRGKLVPQDPNDEPASELLKRVRAEKTRQLKSGELRTQQSLPDKAESEVPFEVPKSWRWVRVDDCFNVGGGIQKTPARTPKNNPHPYIGVGNVYRGKLDLSEVKQFELLEGDLERFRLVKGDILVVEGNGSANEIGRCAVWSGEIEGCVHQNHIIRCRPFVHELTPYVLKYLNSSKGIEVMKALAVTSSGLYSLSVGKIRTIAIPLPPLAEQHRIVAKVDELMAVCDRLEGQLTTAQTESRRLLEAVLHEALAPVDQAEPTGFSPGSSP